MKILLIDTCGTTGSLALAETLPAPAMVALQTMPGRAASERLIPVIREMLAAASIPLSALEAIAVVHGPGSFTGVRVGVAAAKGLCEALGLPLVAISRLAILASMAPRAQRTFAVLDAGRGEFYLGEYDGRQMVHQVLATREEVTAAGALTVVICEPALLEPLAALHPVLVPEPSLADVLPLAAERMLQEAFDDNATLDANYVRCTDVELFARRMPARP